MRTFLLALLFFSIQISYAQDFTKVDSIVNEYPKNFKSIEKFAARISSDFETDLDQTRAAYYWISNNVSYDYKSANSVRIDSYHYNDENELKAVQLKYAENVLMERKGVCEGYSQLLKYVLDELEIKCEVIDGYAKTDFSEIGKVKNEENHAWNAVYLDEKWQLIDATWSTGNDQRRPGYFNFNDCYFLIEPQYLIWSHFPNDKKWQLLEKPISNLAFFYSPIVHSGYSDSGLKLSKMRGIIKSKRIIQLSFDTIDINKTYYYQFSETSLNLEPIEFILKGDKQIAEIPYNYKNGKELTLFDNFEACLSFKIN